MGFPTRSDINRSVQPNKMARGLKFGFCRILYSFVGYLYVSGSGFITVGEERANLSATVYL